MNKDKNEKEGCIILNKPFIGGYIDQSSENEAHELINFFLDDRGKHFIYCSPYGQNVAKAYKKKIKYLLFTSNTKDGSFYIEYVVKIGQELHYMSLPKQTPKTADTRKNKINDAKKQINKSLKELGYKNGIKDVKYGGVSIIDLFTDSIEVIPLTFLANEIYKVNNPIKIKFDSEKDSDNIFDYNFQRNFGYVTSKSKNHEAYDMLNEKIKYIINTDEVKKQTFDKLDLNKNVPVRNATFIDLISMFRQEECYTQILYKLFDYKKELIGDFIKFLQSKKIIEETKVSFDNMQIEVEYSIKCVGRFDLYAHNENVNIILENKIDSGVNYVKAKNQEGKIDQLTRYYNYLERENNGKNIYLIMCPNEKKSYLQAEISNLETENKVKNAFKIVCYDSVYDFFKEKEDVYKAVDFEYSNYLDDILEIFRRLSLTRKQMCEENLLNNINKAKMKN